MPQERIGCLGALLNLFRIPPELSQSIRIAPSKQPSYRLRDDFLSTAELSFYRTLKLTLKDEAVICPKIGLGEIFFVPRREGAQAQRNRIDRKHIDFLLCDPHTMQPLLAIELDDSTHRRPDRMERDRFVDAVFEQVGLPLLRVAARKGYEPGELLELVRPYLDLREVSVPAVEAVTNRKGKPICRKCGVEMVERMASRGARAGEKFWGCVNYPRCREVGY